MDRLKEIWFDQSLTQYKSALNNSPCERYSDLCRVHSDFDHETEQSGHLARSNW